MVSAACITHQICNILNHHPFQLAQQDVHFWVSIWSSYNASKADVFRVDYFEVHMGHVMWPMVVSLLNVWYPCAVVSCALMLDNMALHQIEKESWPKNDNLNPTDVFVGSSFELACRLHCASSLRQHRAMLTWHKVLSCTNRWPWWPTCSGSSVETVSKM